MRDDRERLVDMLESVERIEKHSGVDRCYFDGNEMLQTWMVHNIQIIGEAASKIGEEFRARHSQVPWRAIASMRNTLVHAYFQVDLDEIWSVIQNDLPLLKQQVTQILHNTDQNP
ncbi:MAG: HepT-like ribonuclease domain-containing protein [Armatimonadota bacterium]